VTPEENAQNQADQGYDDHKHEPEHRTLTRSVHSESLQHPVPCGERVH